MTKITDKKANIVFWNRIIFEGNFNPLDHSSLIILANLTY